MTWDKKPQRPQDEEVPPNLDEVFAKLQRRLGENHKRKSSSSAGGSVEQVPIQWKGFLVAGLLLWALAGIYIVSPAERAVVLRFGRYSHTVEPGPHWIPRFIASRKIVNVQQTYSMPYKAEMLTKDENIVDVALSVQYQVDNARDFLFNVISPQESLRQATASALRQVVGHTTLDEILTSGRLQASQQIAEQLKEILDLYKTGLVVKEVNMQPAKPPEAVTAAFDDAIKAREDEQRYINQAKAYQEKVLPIAIGMASRILQEAQAYKTQSLLHAKAEAAPFLALLPAHKAQPKVLEKRLYFAALDVLFKHTSKVLLAVKQGANNMLYLPVDKLIAKRGHLRRQATQASQQSSTVSMDQNESTQRAAPQRLGLSDLSPSSRLILGERRGYQQDGGRG